MPSRTRKRSVAATFVIPLAGLLTVLSARLFDLGNTKMNPDEETALLQDGRDLSAVENEHTVDHERPTKHLVTFLMIAFFTAVLVILCLAFGGIDYFLSTWAANAP